MNGEENEYLAGHRCYGCFCLPGCELGTRPPLRGSARPQKKRPTDKRRPPQGPPFLVVCFVSKETSFEDLVILPRRGVVFPRGALVFPRGAVVFPRGECSGITGQVQRSHQGCRGHMRDGSCLKAEGPVLKCQSHKEPGSWRFRHPGPAHFKTPKGDLT